MLTRVERARGRGINHVGGMRWTGRSQFSERTVLRPGHLLGHGPPLADRDPLPADSFAQAAAARTFMAGAATLRQVHPGPWWTAGCTASGSRRLGVTTPASCVARSLTSPRLLAADRWKMPLLCSFGHNLRGVMRRVLLLTNGPKC